MIKDILTYLHKPQSKRGWVYGFCICVLSLCCAYLTMMLFSSLMIKSYVHRIMPSVILTPLLSSFFAIWFLFSDTFLTFLKKAIIYTLFMILFIVLNIKVF